MTIGFGLVMLANPDAWSRGILAFAAKPYFHAAEIISRLFLGAVMLLFAAETLYSRFVQVVGGVFLLASVILIVGGSHREFAVRAASFRKLFRPAGFAGVLFGLVLIYTGLA